MMITERTYQCVTLLMLMLFTAPLQAAAGEYSHSRQIDSASTAVSSANILTALRFPDQLQGDNLTIMKQTGNLEERAKGLGQQRQSHFDQHDAFTGLYGVGRMEQRLNSNNNAQGVRSRDYLFGLEWELFRRGYFAHKEQRQREELDQNISNRRLEHKMHQHHLNDQLFHLYQFRHTIQAISAKAMFDLTTEQLKKAKVRIHNGYITQVEFIDYVDRQHDADLRYRKLSSVAPTRISSEWFKLLNAMESLPLKSADHLYRQAEQVSSILTLQKTLAEQANLSSDWTDNVSLRLFLHRRQELQRQPEHIVGLYAQIPLDFNRHRNDLVTIEKEDFRLQEQAIRSLLKQQISQLTDGFTLQQMNLNHLIRSYQSLDRKTELAQSLSRSGLSSSGQTPEDDILIYQRKQLMIAEDVLLIRLNMLEKLLRLSSLAGKKPTTSSSAPQPPVKVAMASSETNPEQTAEVIKNSRIAATKATISKVVDLWQKAWSTEDIKRYLSLYAADFKPEHSLSFQRWKQRKSSIFKHRKNIDVSIGKIEIIMLKPDEAKVVFSQRYSDSSQRLDHDIKNLIFEKKTDGWKIIRERAWKISPQ